MDPKVLKEFASLAVEIAQSEAALAKRKARYRQLEALILEKEEPPSSQFLAKSNPEHERSDIVKPQLPWGPNDVRPSRSIAEAVEAVVELGGEATTKDVAVKLGISGNAASVRLARAATAGLLQKVAFGTYTLKPVPELGP